MYSAKIEYIQKYSSNTCTVFFNVFCTLKNTCILRVLYSTCIQHGLNTMQVQVNFACIASVLFIVFGGGCCDMGCTSKKPPAKKPPAKKRQAKKRPAKKRPAKGGQHKSTQQKAVANSKKRLPIAASKKRLVGRSRQGRRIHLYSTCILHVFMYSSCILHCILRGAVVTREAFGTRERTLVTKEKHTFVFYMYLSVDRIH